MRRVKWEPAALMALVLGLGLWIAFGPAGRPSFPISPGALTQTVRIGNDRGLLEAYKASPGDPGYSFRFWMADIREPAPLTRAEAEGRFGVAAVRNTIDTSRNWLFRTLNITSWASVVWVGIGLLGQAAFSGRMVLQWIVSEKKRESVITESFWWFSLFGGVTLFSYFVWRQDPVGILGQASGIVIYVRNIRLYHKRKRRMARAASSLDAAPAATVEAKPSIPARVG